jgi:hypothetical protein
MKKGKKEPWRLVVGFLAAVWLIRWLVEKLNKK